MKTHQFESEYEKMTRNKFPAYFKEFLGVKMFKKDKQIYCIRLTHNSYGTVLLKIKWINKRNFIILQFLNF